jgi:hypothetical protein
MTRHGRTRQLRRSLCGGNCCTRFRKERLSRRGQIHAFACPSEQRHTEVSLASLNRLRKRWLRHSEPRRGAGEIAFFGNDSDVSEALDVHIASILIMTFLILD